MKAIRAHAFGGIEKLCLDDIANPSPGAGEVVVRVHAAGVNPADSYMLGGSYAMVPQLPYVPGGDAAGIVETTAPDVTGFEPGDRVFVAASLCKDLTGCYAERVVRSAKDLMHIPDGIDFAQAAAIGVPYVTAHFSLFARGCAEAGETVFIHGASGAVGTAAIQLAKRAGLTVIGSAGSAAGLDLVRKLGADLAVDHTTPTYLDDVRVACGAKGPALILEMLADVNLASDLELIAPFGRIVIIGCHGMVNIAPRHTMLKEVDILGTAIWNASRAQVRSSLHDLLEGLAEGEIAPIIAATYSLENVAEALEAVLTGRSAGKIVLVPNRDS